jgi:hypothetical protein
MRDISPESGSRKIPQLVVDPDSKSPGHDRLWEWLIRHRAEVVRRLYSPTWSSLVAESSDAKCLLNIPSATSTQQTINASDAQRTSRMYQRLHVRSFTWSAMKELYDCTTDDGDGTRLRFVDLTIQVKLGSKLQVCSRTPAPILTEQRMRDRSESSRIARLYPASGEFHRPSDRCVCTKRVDRFFFDVRYRLPPDSVLIREISTVSRFLPDHLPCLFTTYMPARERYVLNRNGILVMTRADFNCADPAPV